MTERVPLSVGVRLRSAVQRRMRSASSPLAARLALSTFWSAAAEGLSKGMLLVAMVIVGRMLGQASYGEFGIVRSTIGMFASLGGMGLGLTANRFIAEHRVRDKATSGEVIGASYLIALLSGSIVGGALALASDTIATRFIEAPGLAPALRMAGLLLLCSAINGAQIGILQGLEAYRRLALSSVIQGTAAIVCLVVGARWMGVNGAVAGLLAYSAIGCAVFHLSIRRETAAQSIRMRYGNLRPHVPIFMRFTLPLVLAGVAIAPLKWATETLLVRQVGFAQLGVFVAATMIMNTMVALVSTLHAPLVSTMASSGPAGGSVRLRAWSLFGSWYAFLLLSAPLLAFPSLLALPFGSAFATPDFLAASLILLVYGALMMYFQGVLRLVVQRGSMWFAFYTNLVEGAALVVGFVLLSGRGGVGLALAYVASYLVRIAVSMPWLVRHRILPPELLVDRSFVLSVVTFVLLVMARLWILP